MTENEAIALLYRKRECITDNFLDYRQAPNTIEMCDMAIKALEEIQRYRAIGLTPELVEAMQGHNIAMINDLGEYQQIGTVEEFKALKEKNEPKKLDTTSRADGDYVCGNCYEPIPRWDTKYCPDCGQAIDWTGKE